VDDESGDGRQKNMTAADSGSPLVVVLRRSSGDGEGSYECGLMGRSSWQRSLAQCGQQNRRTANGRRNEDAASSTASDDALRRRGEVRGLHGCAKSARRGSGTAIKGEREGEGVLAGKAVAFNSHEAGWWNAIKGEKARFVAKRK
jgi:hypothetical protein